VPSNRILHIRRTVTTLPSSFMLKMC
jgi:hypothetical protein